MKESEFRPRVCTISMQPTHNVVIVVYETKAESVCRVDGTPFTANVTVRYTVGDRLLEVMSFDRWLGGASTWPATTVEELADTIARYLAQLLRVGVQVVVVGHSTAHGKLTVDTYATAPEG